jgi:aspartyl-tRNA(Asn)/glutamyl-tRNA(Gln) amidotransferase subunit B
VRPAGIDVLGTRCEIKNLNSLRSLGRAIEYETQRQIELVEAGQRVVQETRHWNEVSGRTVSGRSKEEAYDYRYFPEPDLVPVAPDDEWIASVRAAMPMLPAARRARLAEAAGVDPRETALVVALDLDTLVLGAIAAGADPKMALNRAGNEIAANIDGASNLSPDSFTRVLLMEAGGQLTSTQAKQVLAELLQSGGAPEAIAKARGFEAMDADALAGIVDDAIAAHPAEWERYKAGDQKVSGMFVGAVMKATGGKADGKAVTALLRDRASAS